MSDFEPIWEAGYINKDGVKETPKQYQYFQEYLKLDSGKKRVIKKRRGIKKLHKYLKKSSGNSSGKIPKIETLEKYSQLFDWDIRAMLYDVQIFENNLENWEKEMEKEWEIRRRLLDIRHEKIRKLLKKYD